MQKKRKKKKRDKDYDRVSSGIRSRQTLAVSCWEIAVHGYLAKQMNEWRRGTGQTGARFMVSHYRGLQVLSQKKTIVRCQNSPSLLRPPRRIDSNDWNQLLLLCYEGLQDESRYTMNAVLARHAEEERKGRRFTLTSRVVQDQLGVNVTCRANEYSLTLTQAARNYLLAGLGLPDLARFLYGRQELKDVTACLNKLHQKIIVHCEDQEHAVPWSPEKLSENMGYARKLLYHVSKLQDKTNASITAFMETTEVKRIAAALHARRKQISWTLVGGNLNSLESQLKGTCEKLFKLFGWGKKDNGAPQFEAVLRMLQGICVYHEYGSSLLAFVYPFALRTLCSVGPESLPSKEYCVSTITWISDSALDNLRALSTRATLDLQRLSTESQTTIAVELKKPTGDDYCLKDVLTDAEPINEAEKALNGSLISRPHLAAVLRLAEAVRPAAIHEGKPIEVAFCVGTIYHLKRYFSDTQSLLSGITRFPRCRLADGVADLAWLPVRIDQAVRVLQPELYQGEMKQSDTDHYARMITECQELCKARIKGNHGILCRKGNVLFVDYLRDWPQITHVGTIAKRLGDLGSPSLRELTARDPDMCIVRVVGRSRMELLHRGRVVISWADNNAAWVIPPQWTVENLSKYLERAFGEAHAPQIGQLAEFCIRLSDTPRSGAAILVANRRIRKKYSADMTDTVRGSSDMPLQDLLSDFDEFRDRVTQDGGTVVTLSGGEPAVRTRQHFMPYEGAAPWCYRTSPVGSRFDRWAEAWAKEGDDLEWPGWYEVLHWGTRHLSCLGMSASLRGQKANFEGELMNLPNSVAICVSDDGPIHLFEHGTCIDPGGGRDLAFYDRKWRKRTEDFK